MECLQVDSTVRCRKNGNNLANNEMILLFKHFSLLWQNVANIFNEITAHYSYENVSWISIYCILQNELGMTKVSGWVLRLLTDEHCTARMGTSLKMSESLPHEWKQVPGANCNWRWKLSELLDVWIQMSIQSVEKEGRNIKNAKKVHLWVKCWSSIITFVVCNKGSLWLLYIIISICKGRYGLSNVFCGTAATAVTNMKFEGLRKMLVAQIANVVGPNQHSAARNAFVFVLKTDNFWFVPWQYSSASEHIHSMFAACLLTVHTSKHHVLGCRISLCHGICSIVCTGLKRYVIKITIPYHSLW